MILKSIILNNWTFINAANQLRHLLSELLRLFSNVKYNSVPDSMSNPKGSRVPIFTFVPVITVCNNFGENCGSLKIQMILSLLIVC